MIIPLFAKISQKDKILFSKNFHTLIQSDIPISETFEYLIEQTKNNQLKNILKKIKVDIDKGSSIYESMLPYEKIFGKHFIEILNIGEKSGNITHILEYLQKYYEKKYDMYKKIKEASAYPIFVLAVSFAVFLFLTLYILPILLGNLQIPYSQLPVSTKILMTLSSILTQYWYIIIALIIILLYILVKSLPKLISQNNIFNHIIIKTPILGNLIKQVNIILLSKNFSLLLKTKITLEESFMLLSKIMPWKLYKNILQSASTKVKQGTEMSKIFKENPQLFPHLTIQLIEVGEKSGRIDDSFDHIANFYEKEMQSTLENFGKILTPLITVILGIIVGFIILSIMLPIYSGIYQGI